MRICGVVQQADAADEPHGGWKDPKVAYLHLKSASQLIRGVRRALSRGRCTKRDSGLFLSTLPRHWSARRKVERCRAGIVALALASISCVQALHGHHTIEGRPFASDRVAEIRPGARSEVVRSVLGEPFEVSEQGGITVWRYFERFYPRGCTTKLLGISLSSLQPMQREAVIRFRDGVVADIQEQPR